jgi:hypothetical protein
MINYNKAMEILFSVLKKYKFNAQEKKAILTAIGIFLSRIIIKK